MIVGEIGYRAIGAISGARSCSPRARPSGVGEDFGGACSSRPSSTIPAKRYDVVDQAILQRERRSEAGTRTMKRRTISS